MGLRADVSAVPVHFSHPYFFWALLANISAVLVHFPYPYFFWPL